MKSGSLSRGVGGPLAKGLGVGKAFGPADGRCEWTVGSRVATRQASLSSRAGGARGRGE